MSSFVLFPQASEPSMNFSISKMEYSALQLHADLSVYPKFCYPIFLRH